MKTLIITASLLIALTACNNQQKTSAVTSEVSTESTNAANAPKIEFKESSYDFGKISEGDKVAHTFKFENTGKSPLIISGATATCGCTQPEYPKEPIKPGESGEIKVVFNSAGKFGTQNKIITITSNAVPQTTEVNLVGEVLEKK
ncbi:DUF1573 domain-containing protein [Rubrolithibacter danxiaensis]|uniref:DUF1573 domain-containing protein n=1 Tax=Rubrolithibacter danxiaensis TaxID=3390805 RepID=UPI003BF8ABC2